MSDQFLLDGMNVIKEYDSATYQAMVRDKWHPVDNLDTFALKAHWGLMTYIREGSVAAGAFGMTQHGTELSYINSDTITQFAQQFGIPTKYFTAAVMVHEYTHTLNHLPDDQIGDNEARQGEITAFEAGRAFATKLPKKYGDPIVRETDKDLGHAKADINGYMQGA